MTPLSPGLRRVALEEFTRRLAVARQQAAAMGEGWPGDPANENLRLWLAIALAAGAGPDLPEDVRRAIAVPTLWPHGQQQLPRPDQIAEAHAWRSELAHLRNQARARAEGSADQRLIQRALDLTHLAEALGAPAIPDLQMMPGKEAA